MRARRYRPGDPIMGALPIRMRPSAGDGDPYGNPKARQYTAVETRNGLPFTPYRWRGRPAAAEPCTAATLPCRRCELAAGCGGLLGQGGETR